MPIENLLQFYLWRWGIETNFRDEKTILGAGQAQVRTPSAVQNVPALIVAAYAMLLIAAQKTFGEGNWMQDSLPRPKWQAPPLNKKISTTKLINHLRAELWQASLGIHNFSGFDDQKTITRKHKIAKPQLQSAILYSIN